MREQARQALARHFGFSAFRAPQEDIVTAVLEKRDVLVIMPTGGGKSLCYQLPALLMEGVTVVVSPLIALMKDQVDALQARGIAAAMINSSQSWNDQLAILDDLREGRLKLIYVAPERFRAESFRRALQGIPIARLAIDEAHCLSQWGHDFRPDYLRLGEARKAMGNPPCLALTATATPEVRRDILDTLELSEPATYVAGFSRKNLAFRISRVEKDEHKMVRIKSLVEAHRTGIIYCATRKSTEAVSEWLNCEHIDHVVYHGGLSDDARSQAQERFLRREVGVAVATNAFGMGIDRADVRFVCHYELPGSIEAYYQEAGRAGRDGKESVCELLFRPSDRRVQEFFLDGANPPPALVHQVFTTLKLHADDQGEVLLSIDDLTAKVGPGTNPMGVGTSLGLLTRSGVIERFDVAGQRIRGTRLKNPGMKARELPLDTPAMDEKRRRDYQKLERMIDLCHAPGCRQQAILRYFGEQSGETCGKCDRCARRSGSDLREGNAEEVLQLRKALSGVARMSRREDTYSFIPRFGRTKIMACLRGSEREDLKEAGLHELSTYGLLKDMPQAHLRALFDEMEASGLIETSGDEYRLVGLTELGARVMLDGDTVKLRWPATAASPSGEDEIDYDRHLYDELVRLRNQMARERKNAPAYTIFPNRVLKHLAAKKPQTAAEAQELPGIGPAKAKSILPRFLKVIQAHARGGAVA
ncbi:MAG: ATP-dependent DNA helicase RecQ [Verrucomicrobiota bacterium JB022]|nr:ATP-dependent DNA helicase RecQ [Verrucomicrobiota bacterium JB022]